MQQNQRGFTFILVLCGLLVVLLLGFIGWHFNKNLQTRNNTAYFSELTQATLTYYKEQAGALNVTPSSNDLDKTCYQSEQSDFDNGRLWCGIQVQRKIKVQPENAYINNLLGGLVSVTNREGFSIVGGVTKVGANGASFTAGIYYNDSKPCKVFVDYSPNSAEADAKTSMNYTLNCAERATSVPAGFSYIPLR